VGLLAAITLAVTFAQVPMTAQADTAPPNPADPRTPITVAADPLATVQINGVAWAQLVVGNTVYVGGDFTNARPAGAADGVNTTPRANLLAYDITTGTLISSWAPATNGAVYALAASPDKSRIYVGGAFTTINAKTNNRIAALNPTTGAVITSFVPKSTDASVRAIAATADTVYFGGVFNSVAGLSRPHVAAVQASNGALLNWAPNAAGGQVSALALSPDGNKILMGGKFITLNGGSNPGYGLGAVGTVLAGSNGLTNLPWVGNTKVRNGGANAGITSLRSEGDVVYATGYVFGSGGTLEGIAQMNWSDGSIVWAEDCHGDTYSTFGLADAVYAVSHAHYCGNLPDGFPETSPRTFHWATAYGKTATGIISKDSMGYTNWAGSATPSLLKWNPLLQSGTYTGQNQAGWSITGNDTYVVIGGEFPAAAGTPQQGLVRYAVKSLAANTAGPIYAGSKFNPTVRSYSAGTVRIGWQANWDRDNEQLTYNLVRDSDVTHPIYTTTQLSSEWSRPMMGYLDTGLTPGQTYHYRLSAKDPMGNEVKSETIDVAAASTGALSPYAQDVLGDGAADYWRAGESSGSALLDSAGASNQTAQAGVTRGAAGAIAGDTDKASTFSGDTTGYASSSLLQAGPNTFSTETWIKTTTTRGGKIIGFGNLSTGASTTTDRHVYMTNGGLLTFGIYDSGANKTVTSTKAYNDGAWHHVVATLGSAGMSLYVDGSLVAAKVDTVRARSFYGYWRIGGDTLTGWPSVPTSAYFAGTIDEAAVYDKALSSGVITQHYTDGVTVGGNAKPRASFTSSSNNLVGTFDGSASSDSDGSVASYAWDFGDSSTSSTIAKPTHTYAAAGTYSVTLTVTDNGGAIGTVNKSVTVTAAPANVKPTAAFTSAATNLVVGFDGSGSTDTDGSVASYAWDFGDSSTVSTAVKPSHTYAAAGDYSVTLTVTDDDGATDSVNKTITVAAAPAGPLAADAFGRTATGGWGTADTGGAWTKSGTTTFAVNNGVGQITATSSYPRIALNSVSSTSSDVTVKVALNKIADGGGVYASVGARTIGTNDYRAKVKVAADGKLTLYLTKVESGTETTLTSVALSSAYTLTTSATTLQVRLQAFGTSPTTVRARVWKSGTTEGSTWQLSTTDSTAALQAAGGVGVAAYLSGTSTNGPIVVSFDDLSVVPAN
jgi:PKD repeat protein